MGGETVVRQRIVLFSLVVIAALVVGWNVKTLWPFFYASPLYGWLAQSQSPSPEGEKPAPGIAPQPTVPGTGSASPNAATVTEETTALVETTALEETTAFQAPEGTKASSSARIACLRADQGASSPPPHSTETLNGDSLTRVLTPKVAAHPEGVHIQFDNRLGKGAEYFTPDSHVAWEVPIPEGKSNQAALLPPGTAKINCSLDGDFRYNYASFEVVEGDSGYKSLELECKPGAEPRFSSFIASADSKFELVSYRDAVEKAREYYKAGLKEGDVVEPAGYPKAKDPNPTVRVVRNGKVIATYWSVTMEMYATYCSGQIYSRTS